MGDSGAKDLVILNRQGSDHPLPGGDFRLRTIIRLALCLTFLGSIGTIAILLTGMGRGEDQLPLRFDPDPFVLPELTGRHEESDIEVAVVNDSDEPAQIVGVREFCGSACFYGMGLPTTVPAHGRGSVYLHVKTNVSGPIEESVTFFTDRSTQPHLTMRIVGNIREEAADDGPDLSSNP